MTDFQHAVVGGTFDHLHAGHKRILDFAFHTAQRVTIGIVGDTLIDTKLFSSTLESFLIRKDSIMTYIHQNEWGKRALIIQLNDIYGPAIESADYDAIVVTRETKPNAMKVNEKRQKNNLQSLSIVTVPLMKGKDNKVIRSTRIREGSINRVGNPYARLFSKSKELALPPRLRNLLRKPLGQIIEGEKRFLSFTAQKASVSIKRYDPTLLIAVGDIVSRSLKKAKLTPNVSVIDFRSRRKKLHQVAHHGATQTLNPPGTIRYEAVKAIKIAINRALELGTHKRVVIKGEEDLLALPAILLAPLESIVVYGQKDFGIVIVLVTEQMKKQVAGIIEQFE